MQFRKVPHWKRPVHVHQQGGGGEGVSGIQGEETRREEEVTDATRRLLMAVRQALIIALGAIEDFLELQRSIVPRRKR